MAGIREPAPDKPICQLVGADGNVFNVIGLVRQTLIDHGQPERASEFVQKAFRAGSYDAVLALCFDYVDVQ